MLYHLISRSEFEGHPSDEPYIPASLAHEGFIHLSATAEQVTWVANAFYRATPDLVALVLDETLLDAPVQWDATPDGRFPHLYGPLERAAIVDIVPLQRLADGNYRFIAP